MSLQGFQYGEGWLLLKMDVEAWKHGERKGFGTLVIHALKYEYYFLSEGTTISLRVNIPPGE